MSWIATIDGNELDLERPAPAHITAFDIAWSLSQLTRFTGRAIRPYSVAEHSLLVCEIAEREFGLDVHGQFAALMHDAHEAYCNDVATPAKALIGPAWAEWERHWERATQSAFAIVTASQVHRKAIKQADLIALATERRDLCIPTPSPWPVLLGVEPVPWVDLYSKERRDMGWQDWRDRWLDQHHALDFARTARLFAVVPATPGAPMCWCETCDETAHGLRTRMSLCPQCGDKRCPKAVYHGNECKTPNIRGKAETTAPPA